jgi:hypothetical protein
MDGKPVGAAHPTKAMLLHLSSMCVSPAPNGLIALPLFTDFS